MTLMKVLQSGNIPRLSKLLFALVVCFILWKIGIQYAVYLGYYRETPSFSGETKYYSFSPESTLNSLETGEQALFFSISEDLFLEEPWSLKSIEWTYTDYLRLVAAFHQFAWGETLEQGWILDFIDLGDDECKELYAFDGITFGFHKHSGDLYIRSSIVVLLSEGVIKFSSYETNYSGKWKGINFTNAEINTPEKAISIAEEQGARDFRLSLSENCRQHVMLAPYGFEHGFPPKPFNRVDWGWVVVYYGENSNKFEIDIDPYSGNHKIINIAE